VALTLGAGIDLDVVWRTAILVPVTMICT